MIHINGDVVYTGASESQVKFGNYDNPTNVLVVGQHYTVSNVEVHKWHTDVWLQGIDGKFNSVWFDELNKPVTPDAVTG